MAIGFISGYVMGKRSVGKAVVMASSAGQLGTSESNRIYDLDDRIDRLTLIIQAMWSLLEDQGLTEKQLQARILEMDESDGQRDGRLTVGAKTCPECGAKVGPGIARCQFCGQEMGDKSPFTGL